jgi:A/G-specific adenine glycosylase
LRDPAQIDSEKLATLRWCRRQLLRWYGEHGRRLAWRSQDVGLYEKVVVEVLLQRTRAETIDRIFRDFFEKFGSWRRIDKTDVVALGSELRPIGLWRRRAESLKALAAEMVRRGGKFPNNREELESLPAVGQYVANAILLFVHKKPEPLLDANMARVLERVIERRRLADLRHDPRLQAFARELVRLKRAIEINWAVLDVGARYCRPKSPKCTDCPLVKRCQFFGRKKKIARRRPANRC